MKNFWKLLNFELNRFSKMYYLLIAVIAVLQIGSVLFSVNSYMNNLNKALASGQTGPQYLEMYGKMSLTQVMNSSLLYVLSIVFGVAVLGIYLFFIWYRDWFGKNAFIYRLLMLPTSRMNLYFSKAAAILLMTFGLLAVQAVLLYVEQQIIQGWVPRDYRSGIQFYHLIEGSQIAFVLPTEFPSFVLRYAGGIVILFTLFTAILFERSYRLRGAIAGLFYCIASMIVFALPMLLETLSPAINMYPNELALSMIASGLIVLVAAMLIGRYLLKNKVTV